MSWHELRRAEKSWEELWNTDMSWDEMGRDETCSVDMGREENNGMRWDEVKKLRRHELRWDELKWDGMTQTSVTMGRNEQFPREAATRWDQKNDMGKDPTFTRHGIRLTSREIVAVKHKSLRRILWTQSLPRSISYKLFNFETSAPGLPGYDLYFDHPISSTLSILFYTFLIVSSACSNLHGLTMLHDASWCPLTFFTHAISHCQPKSALRPTAYALVSRLWFCGTCLITCLLQALKLRIVRDAPGRLLCSRLCAEHLPKHLPWHKQSVYQWTSVHSVFNSIQHTVKMDIYIYVYTHRQIVSMYKRKRER